MTLRSVFEWINSNEQTSSGVPDLEEIALIIEKIETASEKNTRDVSYRGELTNIRDDLRTIIQEIDLWVIIIEDLYDSYREKCQSIIDIRIQPLINKHEPAEIKIQREAAEGIMYWTKSELREFARELRKRRKEGNKKKKYLQKSEEAVADRQDKKTRREIKDHSEELKKRIKKEKKVKEIKKRIKDASNDLE